MFRRVQSSAGSAASGQVLLIPKKYLSYVTKLVGRSLISSSDGPGSYLGGFNPPLALKQAAKCRSHIKEIQVLVSYQRNIYHMSLSSVGRSLISSSDDPGSTLGGFNPQLVRSKRPSVYIITKKIFCTCHLAQLVER